METQTQSQASDSGNETADHPPTVNRQAQSESDLNANKTVGGVWVPNLTDPGDTPIAGDVDPDATASADETGQGGDVTEEKKRKALPWG